MYFVDRSAIEKTLVYIDKLLYQLDQYSYDSYMEKLSLERTVHMIIESILDVGNMMIDGFIMRDPGSYEDIIDILIDENVLPEQDEACYKQVIQLRNIVVKGYLTVDHGVLKDTLLTNKREIDKFSSHVITYLNNELGVANAFSNE